MALEKGETVARTLDAVLRGRPLEAFTFHDKGFIVSIGTRRGVADIAGITTGWHLAHPLKEAIEREYHQSVRHLPGWDPASSRVTAALYPTRRDGLRPFVLGCRMSTMSSNAGSKRP